MKKWETENVSIQKSKTRERVSCRVVIRLDGAMWVAFAAESFTAYRFPSVKSYRREEAIFMAAAKWASMVSPEDR